MVRGVTPLPHGTARSAGGRLARGKLREAEEAGADAVGAEELVARIQAGADKEFDVFLPRPM